MLHTLDGMREWYTEVMSHADPRVKNTAYTVDPVFVLSVVTVYLLFVTYGPKWMEQQKAMKFKSLLVTYNFSMVFLSAFVFLDMLLQAITTRISWFCAPIDSSDSYIGRGNVRVAWWFFTLKVIELLDTIFFVLRKKNSQITFLHVYHHATMVIVTWLGLTFLPGGNAFVHPLVNSLIHVVMYSYYGMSALGPHMQKYLWWKRYLTLMQLVQFVVMISHSLVNFYTECSFPKLFSALVMCYSSSIMLLFLNFYYRAYVQKTHIKEQNKSIAINGTTLSNLSHVDKIANGVKPVVGKKKD